MHIITAVDGIGIRSIYRWSMFIDIQQMWDYSNNIIYSFVIAVTIAGFFLSCYSDNSIDV